LCAEGSLTTAILIKKILYKLIKLLSKRLKKFGYDKHDVIAVISEMLEIIIKEIKIEK